MHWIRAPALVTRSRLVSRLPVKIGHNVQMNCSMKVNGSGYRMLSSANSVGHDHPPVDATSSEPARYGMTTIEEIDDPAFFQTGESQKQGKITSIGLRTNP